MTKRRKDRVGQLQMQVTATPRSRLVAALRLPFVGRAHYRRFRAQGHTVRVSLLGAWVMAGLLIRVDAAPLC